MTGQLVDKVIIVTGSGRGIGRAIALGYAQEGARVAVTARSRDEIEDTANQIRTTGGSSLAVVADISRESDVKTMVDTVTENWGRVDILVNNAGLRGPVEPIYEVDMTAVDRTWAVNVRGMFLCCRAVIPIMIKKGGGNIINVTSGAGFRSARKHVRSLAYQISKFGVEGLTSGLAVQLKEFKINVNSLSPGPIATHLHSDTPPERIAAMGGLGQPADVVPAAIFLATRPPGQFTDQVVKVREFDPRQPGTVSR